jgi:hypothetical protein
MAVGQEEEGLITLALYDGKQTLELLLCEELHCAGAAPGFEFR